MSWATCLEAVRERVQKGVVVVPFLDPLRAVVGVAFEAPRDSKGRLEYAPYGTIQADVQRVSFEELVAFSNLPGVFPCDDVFQLLYGFGRLDGGQLQVRQVSVRALKEGSAAQRADLQQVHSSAKHPLVGLLDELWSAVKTT